MGYNGSLQHKKVLITCGPTWVRIDPVRVISNISSGELAHTIAQNLSQEKARVTLLQGPITHQTPCPSVKITTFKYFDELSYLLKKELKKTPYDIVIHAAAVSDYKLKTASTRKMSSHFENLTLRLTPTPKLINQIKKIRPKTFLVGFKLESNPKKNSLYKKAKQLINDAHCNLVVANTITPKGYQASIIDTHGYVLAKANARRKIASTLIKTIKEQL